MPTYEYRCTECEHEFEELQRITADPLKECPKCQGAVKRLISGGGGILFKGSGFHVTDYRSSDYKKSAEADKPKDASKPKSDSPKTDGKDKKKKSDG